MANVEHSECVFYSFEMKITIGTPNELRKCFFQALSNSSWANYGYLVAAQYSETIVNEMKELNEAYGIGFIQLDTDNYMDSSIVLPAIRKKEIDWNRVDFLNTNNQDFKRFIEGVNTNMRNRNKKKILMDTYDKIFTDEDDFKEYKAKELRGLKDKYLNK